MMLLVREFLPRRTVKETMARVKGIEGAKI